MQNFLNAFVRPHHPEMRAAPCPHWVLHMQSSRAHVLPDFDGVVHRAWLME